MDLRICRFGVCALAMALFIAGSNGGGIYKSVNFCWWCHWTSSNWYQTIRNSSNPVGNNFKIAVTLTI